MMGTVLESPPIEAMLRECHRQHQFRLHEHQLHIVRHIHTKPEPIDSISIFTAPC